MASECEINRKFGQIPEIGAVMASALVATIGDAKAFEIGRFSGQCQGRLRSLSSDEIYGDWDRTTLLAQ